MMFGKQKLALIRETAFVPFQFFEKDFFLKELFPEPDRDGHIERFEAAGRVGDISFKQSFELQKRLFVECYMINLAQRQSGFIQNIFNRLSGETGIMLLSAKTFLLSGSSYPTVPDKRCGAVVIKRRNSQDTCHLRKSCR